VLNIIFLKGNNVEEELAERLLKRLKVNTDLISNLAERVITKDSFPIPNASLQETIKSNQMVIDEAEKQTGT
jgi:hypothetical protein